MNERICHSGIKWNERGRKYSPELKNLVMRLLDRDPTTRIGSNGSYEEILTHKAFDQYFLSVVSHGEYRP